MVNSQPIQQEDLVNARFYSLTLSEEHYQILLAPEAMKGLKRLINNGGEVDRGQSLILYQEIVNSERETVIKAPVSGRYFNEDQPSELITKGEVLGYLLSNNFYNVAYFWVEDQFNTQLLPGKEIIISNGQQLIKGLLTVVFTRIPNGKRYKIGVVLNRQPNKSGLITYPQEQLTLYLN